MSKKLLAFGIASPVLYVGVTVLGSALRPDYSHLSNAVSELLLVGAPYRLLLSLGMGLSSACMVVGCIAALRQTKGMGKVFRVAVALLLCTGVGGLFTALVWPQDPVGAPATFSGTMHIGLVAVAAIFSMVAPVLVAVAIRRRTGWQGLFWLSLICAGLALVFSGAFTRDYRPEHPIDGVVSADDRCVVLRMAGHLLVKLMVSDATSDLADGG